MANVSKRGYKSSSEFVAVAHPDRLSDLIASIIINDIQHRDGYNSHAAIEVFLTHDTCTIAGEAKTTLPLTEEYLRNVVREAYQRAGYLPGMRKYWTRDEVCLADDLKIENRVFAQSPDIALGTTDKAEDTGYNDQGIFFSSSENTNHDHLGVPMLIARDIGDCLSAYSRASIMDDDAPLRYGPDIKVVVTCDVADDGFTPLSISAITIAIPHSASSDIVAVRNDIQATVMEFLEQSESRFKCGLDSNCVWTINGTGRFVVHGNISDCSMTGRKISVNHPSAGPIWCNKMIGGGSQIKPSHASDLILPLAARYIANILVDSGYTSYAVVGIACAIGQHSVQSIFIHGDNKFEADPEFVKTIQAVICNTFNLSPRGLIELFQLNKIDFSKVCEANFYGEDWLPWDNKEIIADGLKKFKEALA